MEYNTNLETYNTSENPGKDPNNTYYLKFCFVCQEEAKPDQVSNLKLKKLVLKARSISKPEKFIYYGKRI